MKSFNNIKIGILGLGYAGLPLAIEFGKKFEVLGFDKNSKRILELKKSHDKNFEINQNQFKKAYKLIFSNNLYDLKRCNVFIVSVPTPINKKKSQI